MPFTNPLVAGTTLIRTAIRSKGYVAGSAGWSVNSDGSAEFNNVTVRGKLYVVGASGSYLQIDKDGSNDPFIALSPPDPTNLTWDPATITTLSVPAAPTGELQLQAPRTPIAGGVRATMHIQGGGNVGDNKIIIDSPFIYSITGHHFPIAERGTNSTAIGAASTSVTSAVITFINPFVNSPIVIPVLTNTSAASAGWIARAINISTTQFQILFMGAAPGGTGFTAGVQWIAQDTP